MSILSHTKYKHDQPRSITDADYNLCNNPLYSVG